MEIKICANCANGVWTRIEQQVPEVCTSCHYRVDGVPSAWKPIVQTNADRIRAMSDEELADVVVCPYTCNWDLCRDDCKKCRLEWLKQPAEDNNEN